MFGFFRKKGTRDAQKFLNLTEVVQREHELITGIMEKKPHLPEQTFRMCNERIRELVVEFSPSGTNGRTEAFGATVSEFLASQKINPIIYWQDVWVRSGSKNWLDYNDAKRGRQQA